MLHQEIKIPNKSLFKLDEVCSLTGVKPYVLRFWESEFQQIDPILSSTGQKLFEHKDIEAVLLVKDLLFIKKMTIENAKFEIDKIYNQVEQQEIPPVTESVSETSVQKPVLSMSLNSQELKKLDEAKILLKDLITLTKTIQTNQNWI